MPGKRYAVRCGTETRLWLESHCVEVTDDDQLVLCDHDVEVELIAKQLGAESCFCVQLYEAWHHPKPQRRAKFAYWHRGLVMPELVYRAVRRVPGRWAGFAAKDANLSSAQRLELARIATDWQKGAIAYEHAYGFLPSQRLELVFSIEDPKEREFWIQMLWAELKTRCG